MKNDDSNKNNDLEGFESVAVLAKRAQYKVMQRPIAYSVVGGIHNMGGKVCHFRFRIEFAEQMGWKLGDCVDVRLNRETGYVAVFKCEERGYKLAASSKRNGISSYRVGIRWQEDFGFPNVFTQVGCEVIKEIKDGVILRIRTEDDEKPLGDVSYKEPTKIEGDSFGFTPRTLTHQFNDQKSIKDIRHEMEIGAKIEKGENAEKKLERVREILQRPIKRRRKAMPEGEE